MWKTGSSSLMYAACACAGGWVGDGGWVGGGELGPSGKPRLVARAQAPAASSSLQQASSALPNHVGAASASAPAGAKVLGDPQARATHALRGPPGHPPKWPAQSTSFWPHVSHAACLLLVPCGGHGAGCWGRQQADEHGPRSRGPTTPAALAGRSFRRGASVHASGACGEPKRPPTSRRSSTPKGCGVRSGICGRREQHEPQQRRHAAEGARRVVASQHSSRRAAVRPRCGAAPHLVQRALVGVEDAAFDDLLGRLEPEADLLAAGGSRQQAVRA
jgi:hypothetical protein